MSKPDINQDEYFWTPQLKILPDLQDPTGS